MLSVLRHWTTGYGDDMGQEVVVAYDGTPQSRAAVEWAAQECRLRRTGMTLCQVWCGPCPGRQEGVAAEERRLAGRCLSEGALLAERLGPGVAVHPALIRGDPRETLAAMGRDAAMLVVGQRAPGRLVRLLLGSVGAYLAACAACPVVVVRGPHPPRGRPVVAGVDGSPAACAALAFAAQAARRRGVPLVAVHALGLDGADPGRAERALGEAVRPWRGRGGPP
ncbi:universal stress protein, partial [Microbispora sp. ATCC PTA-5024]|uniref:universal stress protein n=1 Tax=Microbispora sp. ATCC PTA-5024 TaxID=316330 RepID=UPI0018DB5CF1